MRPAAGALEDWNLSLSRSSGQNIRLLQHRDARGGAPTRPRQQHAGGGGGGCEERRGDEVEEQEPGAGLDLRKGDKKPA